MNEGAVPLECARCLALPTLHDQPEGYTGPLRPIKPRPVVYGQRRDSARCATHRREDVKAAKVRAHDTSTQRTYGVPAGWYAEQYERQGRKCAFPRCRATGKTKRLAVDHDRALAVQALPDVHPVAHAKDRACRYCVRGLLCGPHNYTLIGVFGVDLQDGLDYLADPPARRWTWTGEAA